MPQPAAGTRAGAQACRACSRRPSRNSRGLPPRRSARGFTAARDEARIAAEVALDGIYVIRTNVSAAAAAARRSIVSPAVRSPAARRKVARRQTEDGVPLHSFRTLLLDLATLTRNTVWLGEAHFQQLTTPTPLQQRAFQLLDVQP